MFSMVYNKFPLSFLKTNIMHFNMPTNLSFWWNFGSLLGMTMMMQIVSGVFLSFFYVADEHKSFYIVSFLMENDVFFGYLLRLLHLNLASFFFVCIYLHMFRNFFYKSFSKNMVWVSGVTLLLVLMLTAFMGYVLPWGQMSFWGASVITSFLTVVPYVGKTLVFEMWSSFSIGQNMLSFFFSLHYLFPLVMLCMVMLHVMMLHMNMSSNKIFSMKSNIKKPFNILLVQQDMYNLSLIFIFIDCMMLWPFMFDDPENSKMCNDMSSPLHIKPEWYFLFAYAILRSIPNKLGGVLAMGMSATFFYMFIFKKNKKMSYKSNMSIIFFFNIFILLTWIGGKPVEEPFIYIGQMLVLMYFMFMMV